MMKATATLTTILLLSACSSSGSGTDTSEMDNAITENDSANVIAEDDSEVVAPNSGTEQTGDADAEYNTTFYPIFTTDASGGACPGGDGDMFINGETISGVWNTDIGILLDVRGLVTDGELFDITLWEGDNYYGAGGGDLLDDGVTIDGSWIGFTGCTGLWKSTPK